MIKSIIRETSIYGFSSILIGLTRIALLPLYTRIFSPEDYGVIALITSVTLLLAILMTLSTETAYTKYYHETTDHVQFLSSLINFRILLGLFILFLFIFVSFIAEYFRFIDVDIILLIISGITVYITGISDLLKLYLRMKQHPWLYLINSALSAVFTIFFVYLLLYISPTIHYYFIGQLIGTICGLGIIYFLIHRLVHIQIFEMFHTSQIHRALSFSLPLIPASFAQILNNNASKWFLSTSSMQQVGIFEYGNNISSVFVMFNSIIRTAFLPHSMKIITYKHYDAQKILVNLSNLYIYAVMIAWVLFSQLSTAIARYFAPDQFQDANYIIDILSLTSIIYTLTIFSTLGSWYANKSSDYSIAILCGTFTNIALLFYFIRDYGIISAAFAALLSNIVTTAISFYLSDKRHSYHYMYWHIIAQIVNAGIYLIFILDNAEISGLLSFCCISTLLFILSRIREHQLYKI